jgi:hypothetical protein
MRFFLALFLALLVMGCGPAATNFQTVALPSGKQVKVLGVTPISFAKGPPALMLKYETDLSIGDKVAVQKEVDEIWSSFRQDVEHANMTYAIISATEKPSGLIITNSRGDNFVFKKAADGSWSQTGH